MCRCIYIYMSMLHMTCIYVYYCNLSMLEYKYTNIIDPPFMKRALAWARQKKHGAPPLPCIIRCEIIFRQSWTPPSLYTVAAVAAPDAEG